MPKPLGLWPHRLRAGEQIGHCRYRAGRGANVALDAQVGGHLGGEQRKGVVSHLIHREGAKNAKFKKLKLVCESLDAIFH